MSGIIHFHDTFPDTQVENAALTTLSSISDPVDRSLEILKVIRVKSYAPGIGHYVFDVRVE
jgi:tRNA wybutosine-synthesizing protein 2